MEHKNFNNLLMMSKFKYLIINIVLIIFTHSVTNGQSIDLDKKIGKTNFETVVKTYGLYKDSSMNIYINKVGQRLVSKLDTALFEYKFYIVKNEVPNAFALPGGYIFITTSLLPIINTEDELAGIIGHEIIHSNNRHSVRQIKKRIIPAIITLPIDIVADIVPIFGTLTSPIKSAESMLFASYSRKFETEADEQGVILAAKAGYDPLALISALNRLMNTFEYMTGEKEEKSYFADHPYTPDREANIKAVTKNIVNKKTEKITKDFVKEFDGLMYGTNPDKGIVKNNELTQLKKDFFIKFPKFWILQNHDTLVVGYSPNKNAAYVLAFDDNKDTPEELAKKYIDSISKKHKDNIVSSQKTKVNGVVGYVIHFEQVSYSDTTFANILWLPIGENMFKISTVSNIKDNKTIQDITKSIRILTKSEKESVMVKYIKIATAKENETIVDLCRRTNNKVQPDMIAVINGININTKLKEGQDIKIVLEKKFLQK